MRLRPLHLVWLLAAAPAAAQLSAGGASSAVPIPKDSSTGAQGGSTGGTTNRGGSGETAPAAPRPEDKLAPLDPKAANANLAGAKTVTPHAEPRPKDAPRTPTADEGDRSGFETWWLLNREALLDLHAKSAESARSGDGASKEPLRAGGVAARDVELRLLPALERLADRETNAALLCEVLIAMARVVDAPSARPTPNELELRARLAARFRAALAHPQAQVAESAALALGLLGDGADLGTLIDLARDGRDGRAASARDSVPYRLRAFAAYAVGLAAHATTSEDVRRYGVSGLALVLAARETPREVQVACVNALGISELASDPKSWRASVQRTARELEPTASREALAAHLLLVVANDRANAVLRAQALVAVARLARGAAEPVRDEVERACVELLASTAHPPNELAQSAALALGMLSDAGGAPLDREARARLSSAAREADLDTRHFALLALGALAARPDEDPGAPFAGAPEAHRFLLKELTEGRGAARAFAALALGLYGRGLRDLGRAPSNEAGDALVERMQKASTPDEVAACALALGLRKDPTVVPALRARWDQASDDLVRAATSVALGLVGDGGMRVELRRALLAAKARPTLARELAVALALLGDNELVPTVCKELASAAGSAERLNWLQVLAIVGDARALDPLFALAADDAQSVDVRARAAATLGAIGDGRRLPWNDAYVGGANYLAGVETFSDARGTGLLDRR
ncbi:MAG: HEAT repeat domain-containing protein [Planctomycetota bacterium]